MRDLFPGYYKPTTEEFDRLWSGAFIAFDASSLLNIYRQSPARQDGFLRLLKELKGRLHLPHQAAHEFHRNRCSAIISEAKRFEGTLRNLRVAISELEPATKNSFIENELLKRIGDVFSEIEDSLNQGIATLKSRLSRDSINEGLSEIFETSVGESYPDETLQSIYSEGKKRYGEKVPPGYADHMKPDPEKYGDLIIWKQLITESKARQADAIFVTDDDKEDWWLIIDGTRLGPRPELLDEFKKATGFNIYIYNTPRFVEFANKRTQGLPEDASMALAELAQDADASPGESKDVSMHDTIQDQVLLSEQKKILKALLALYSPSPVHQANADRPSSMTTVMAIKALIDSLKPLETSMHLSSSDDDQLE